MAKIHGVPGEWARVKGVVTGLLPVFVSVFILGVSVTLALMGLLVIGFVLLLTSLFAGVGCAVKGFKRIERHFLGARGEERVARILASLSDRYHVFNDFTACGINVDHVVVGPAGVFAVETKNWNGKVTIEDGRILVDGVLPSRSPLAQIQRESDCVRRELEKTGWRGAVTPLLVFASNSFVSHIAELNGVVVINSNQICKSFSTERVVVAPDEVDRLVALMENNV